MVATAWKPAGNALETPWSGIDFGASEGHLLLILEFRGRYGDPEGRLWSLHNMEAAWNRN